MLRAPFGPENGDTYTPIELSAIWDLEVNPDEHAREMENVYQFHLKASTFDWNPQAKEDVWALNLIVRAVCAEVMEPNEAPPPIWPCPWHYDDGTPRSEDDGA